MTASLTCDSFRDTFPKSNYVSHNQKLYVVVTNSFTFSPLFPSHCACIRSEWTLYRLCMYQCLCWAFIHHYIISFEVVFLRHLPEPQSSSYWFLAGHQRVGTELLLGFCISCVQVWRPLCVCERVHIPTETCCHLPEPRWPGSHECRMQASWCRASIWSLYTQCVCVYKSDLVCIPGQRLEEVAECFL